MSPLWALLLIGALAELVGGLVLGWMIEREKNEPGNRASSVFGPLGFALGFFGAIVLGIVLIIALTRIDWGVVLG